MNIETHKVVHDLGWRRFRYLVTIQNFFEDRQEIEDSDLLSTTEAETLHLLSDATGPLSITADDIWTQCRGYIV